MPGSLEELGGGVNGANIRAFLEALGLSFALPASLGGIAWNFDIAASSNNTAPANGTIYLARIDVTHAATVTKLRIAFGAGATTPTAGQNWLALLDSNGNVLQSVNIDAATPTSGLCEVTIPATPVTGGTYYVAVLQNAATPATLNRGSGVSPVALNAGLAVTSYRWATNGTAQTTITNRTMSANQNTGATPFWAELA